MQPASQRLDTDAASARNVSNRSPCRARKHEFADATAAENPGGLPANLGQLIAGELHQIDMRNHDRRASRTAPIAETYPAAESMAAGRTASPFRNLATLFRCMHAVLME